MTTISFQLRWQKEAAVTYQRIESEAKKAFFSRKKNKKSKSSKQEGLFKQIRKTIFLLKENPRHTGLHTHEYDSLSHPWDSSKKVFEAYAQNKTPGAYRIFWCYGLEKKEITILAITPHP